MYLLKFLISFLGPWIDVSLEVRYQFPRALDKSILDLEFRISFIEYVIDICLNVPYKFPAILDRCSS